MRANQRLNASGYRAIQIADWLPTLSNNLRSQMNRAIDLFNIYDIHDSVPVEDFNISKNICKQIFLNFVFLEKIRILDL